MGLLLKLFGKPNAAEARESFAYLAIKALRVAGIQESIEYDAEGFSLKIRSRAAAEQNVSLAEFYRSSGWDVTTDREDAVARVAEAAAGVARVAPEMAPEFEDAKLHLRPLVRADDEYCEDGSAWASRPYASVLRLGLGYDFPDTVARVSEDQLEAWGISLEDALTAAMANLQSISPRPFVEIRPGVFASPYADVYDSSRLLLTASIRQLPLAGDPVAVAPTRTCLLVAGSRDDDAVAEMLTIAQRAQAEEYPVSLRPLRLSSEGWRAIFG